MSLFAFACSNDTKEQKQDYVFKGYENALEKAKQVQPQMEEAEEKRRKQIEDMMR
jgi:tRNA A-37 threonylcarbamoyl transferase component Bud32